MTHPRGLTPKDYQGERGKRKEPLGSDKWPVLPRSQRAEKDDPDYVPCFWSEHGHEETPTTKGYGKKYAEGYDKIKWDK